MGSRGTVVFFPMLQIQRAIFDNLLAIGCPARHPDGGLQQRAEKCRTMGGLSRRFFQQVSNSFFVSDIVWLLHNELPGGHSSTRHMVFLAG